MNLSVSDRVLLGNLLSAYKGSFANLKVIREGRESLSFSDEELTDLNFVEANGQVQWNLKASEKYQSVDIEFSNTVIEIIRNELLKLNDQSQLTMQYFSLYETFVRAG